MPHATTTYTYARLCRRVCTKKKGQSLVRSYAFFATVLLYVTVLYEYIYDVASPNHWVFLHEKLPCALL